ncbi:MAG: ATP-dependent RecD-like DNA helicase [Pseudomonadota bacterium]
MTTELQGQVERITYSNEETGFTVARVRVQGLREPAVVVGTLPSIRPGEFLTMKGECGRHPQHGRQFTVRESVASAPSSLEGIRKYLGSGLIKGVGPELAKRLVDQFGRETLEVIENRTDRLREVEGIGPKRIGMIKKAWDEQKGVRDVLIFLREHGLGTGYAVKIFQQYGEKSIAAVTADPYRLAHEVRGIGFRTADQIARGLGFALDSEPRVKAGVLHVLLGAADEGHVYVPYDDLLGKCERILGVGRDTAAKGLAAAAAEGFLVLEDPGGDADEYRANDKMVFLTGYHVSETQTARRLGRLARAPKEIRLADLELAGKWVREEISITLAPAQMEAVRQAVTEKVLVITGGPGTGKTTIIRAVLAVYRRLGATVLLAAPTGRAAKRLGETSGAEAKTIHRLLEFSPKDGFFKKNEQEPLDCDLLVLDEASMIDITLMHHLLKAVAWTTALILVGDVDQLPSVGPGNVLSDIIRSGVVPVAQLKEIFRQARESAIILNAHRVNEGLMPLPNPPPDRPGDFYFIERPQADQALETIIHLVTDRVPKSFGLPPDEIQVLCPMHRGLAGTENLNMELQKRLNPGAGGLERGGYALRAGDRVMQIRNNYDKDVFNGDIGRVTSVHLEERELKVWFEGRTLTYDFSEVDELTLAYAISVHKAQGSEYPAVVVPILTEHFLLLRKNLVYTALTRGKRLVILVGARAALAQALKSGAARERLTRLAERLRGGKKGSWSAR